MYFFQKNVSQVNMIKKKTNTVDRDDELFKENNDQFFSNHSDNNQFINITNNFGDIAKDNLRKSKRSNIFKQGIKSKSLDIFDRPDLSSVSSQPSSRRQLSRVRSLASIPEHSIQVRNKH